MNNKNNKGFTLIEMSIVMVIIALIVVGILAGQSLIKSANIRSVISETKSFHTLLNAFELKFAALPGDMLEATSYWPAAGVTENGDGDGWIEVTGGASGTVREDLRAWQHLSLAEMTGAPFTGALDNAKITVGTNVPSSKLAYGGYWLVYSGVTSAAGERGKLENFLTLGKEDTSNGLTEASLSGVDAYDLDNKIDDKDPLTGKVMSSENINGSATNCVNASNAYDRSTNDVICRPLIWLK